MHTHNIIYGAHACRNGKSILYYIPRDQYQNIIYSDIFKFYAESDVYEKSKRRDV